MNLKPVAAKRVYQEIIGKFVDFIANEEIQIGGKLPSERELSERFGAGRPSVREALRVMQTIGLVEIRPGGGAYLTEFNLGPFLDLFSPLILKRKNFGLELLEVRQILEVRAAELAAVSVTETDAAVLREILLSMEAAIGVEDHEQGVRADIQFHKAIFKSTGNIVLIKGSELVNSLMEVSITDARKLVLEHAETSTRLYEEHKAIFTAIKSGNRKKAAAAMLKHLEMVRKVYEQYYSRGLRLLQ